MPLLNESVKVFEDPTFYFSDSMFIETIYIEDLGAFFSSIEAEYKDGLSPETRCIYVEEPTFGSFFEYAKSIAIKIKYVLNFFALDNPILIPYAYLLSKGDYKRSSKIMDIADVEAVANLHKFKAQCYEITSNREKLSDFFKIVDKACETHPAALFTLDRFNSCLTRVNELDRIVDACVSLESLISGNQELSFRFSLYHSLIAEPSIGNRAEAFEAFRNLYNARSSIVHGDLREKDLTKVKDKWLSTKQLAIAAINYYLAFLYENPANKWDVHLRNLALNIDKRIID